MADTISILRSVSLFIVAGVCEIGGGWLIWKWLRDDRPTWWGLLGAVVLILYGIIPTLQTSHFGRVYAVYGGFFIVLALLWGWYFDGNRPDRADVIGGAIALVGVCVMMYWPRPPVENARQQHSTTGGVIMTIPDAKRVVFVCVENSNRSQMAEAFARIHGTGKVEAFSAGSRPSGRVSPKAVEAMKEVGYDLTTHTSKPVAEFNGKEFDAAVTMGCGDECPLVLAKQRVDWKIPDPRDMAPEQFREVRDLIETKVKELLSGL